MKMKEGLDAQMSPTTAPWDRVELDGVEPAADGGAPADFPEGDVGAEEGEEEEPAAVDEILPDDPPPLDSDEEINGRDVN